MINVIGLCSKLKSRAHSAQGPIAISGKKSYCNVCKISQCLKLPGLGIKMLVSLWNLAGTLTVVLPRFQPDLRAIKKHRSCTYYKTSDMIFNGPLGGQIHVYVPTFYPWSCWHFWLRPFLVQFGFQMGFKLLLLYQQSGFTLPVRPACCVCSVAHCLCHGLYSYVAQIQPIRERFVSCRVCSLLWDIGQ